METVFVVIEKSWEYDEWDTNGGHPLEYKSVECVCRTREGAEKRIKDLKTIYNDYDYTIEECELRD